MNESAEITNLHWQLQAAEQRCKEQDELLTKYRIVAREVEQRAVFLCRDDDTYYAGQAFLRMLGEVYEDFPR